MLLRPRLQALRLQDVHVHCTRAATNARCRYPRNHRRPTMSKSFNASVRARTERGEEEVASTKDRQRALERARYERVQAKIAKQQLAARRRKRIAIFTAIAVAVVGGGSLAAALTLSSDNPPAKPAASASSSANASAAPSASASAAAKTG